MVRRGGLDVDAEFEFRWWFECELGAGAEEDGPDVEDGVGVGGADEFGVVADGEGDAGDEEGGGDGGHGDG